MTTRIESATAATALTGTAALAGTAELTGTAGTQARSTPRDLSLLDMLTVAAIMVVVVLVSIPRLRGFALRENELDAMRMLRALAAQPAPANHEQLNHDLAALVAQDVGLCRRLEDLEFLQGGRLRRHGYLFDLSLSKAGEPMLRAWPWEHGTTGRNAFVWTPRRGLLGSPNTDGRFTGPEGAPPPREVDLTWLSIPYRR